MDLPAPLLATLLAGWHGPAEPPPLADLERFPPRAVAKGWIDFAEACDGRAAERQDALQAAGLAGCPEWERLGRLRGEIGCRQAKWAWLYRATDPDDAEAGRRECLRGLWYRTSWREYYAGALPPPVPPEYSEEGP